MDTANDITSCGQESTVKLAGDSSPAADKLALNTCDQNDEVPELSRLASVHITDTQPDNCSEVSVRCLDDVEQEVRSSHELLDNPDSSDQNGKIPNRDSGIDSPSCAAEGEVFPNEDAIDEEDHYDSVTETESVSCCVPLSNQRDSTQDEDSDLDEGSSGEIHSLTDTQSGYLTDTQLEAQKVSKPHRRSLTGNICNQTQTSIHMMTPSLFYLDFWLHDYFQEFPSHGASLKA